MKKLLIFLVLALTLISFSSASSILSIISPANESLITSYENGLFRTDVEAIMVSDNQSISTCVFDTYDYFNPSQTYHFFADFSNNTIYNETSLYLFQDTLNVIETYCWDSLNDTKVYTFTTAKIYYESDDIPTAFFNIWVKVIILFGQIAVICLLIWVLTHIFKEIKKLH